MDGRDENSIDDFAMEILRRAKERSQVISGRLRHPEPVVKEQSVEEIMEKLGKRSSGGPASSPKKLGSPVKLGTRPILKPSNDNTEQPGVPEQRSVKKTVTTCDAMTGDTIVEAKTFISDEDNEEEDSDAEMDAEDNGTESNADGDDNIEDLPKDEELENDTMIETPKVETTPQLSKTLKKLADFHSKEEVDSPVHSHTPLETFNHGHGDVNMDEIGRGHVSASRNARTSRLSALARTINEWEDDTTHLSIPGSRFHETAATNNRASLAGKSRYSSASSPSASSPLNLGASRQSQTNGELQGFSRRQGSPLKQIRERTPDPLPEHEEEDQSIKNQLSPKKTYFGGSPSKGSPFKSTPSHVQVSSPANSPSRLSNVAVNRSPIKSAVASPVASSPLRSAVATGRSPSPMKSIVNSPLAAVSNNRDRSPSPVKSPRKPGFSSSPRKIEKTSSSESTPVGKPVSAIRMKFEAGGAPSKSGPVKPERSRLNPYSAPSRNNFKSGHSSSPTKKFNFGETEKDPSTLSVAERAKLFEKSKFSLVPAKKPFTFETQPKTPTIFTSSPCVDNVKPQEIDVSSVASVPVEQDVNVSSPKKRAAPQPPKATSPINYGKGPAPPPPPLPPMPTTSTPTNANAKRRSTSPARAFPKESHSVKRIKVNAPKPGRIYPSLTDIETETETEAEGHCSEVESMDDSIGSEQSLGAEIETIAKACSPIRPSGGRMPSRYRPSEDFSATFACAEVDALIDEALEGQDMTTTINCSSTLLEAEKTVSACPGLENISENGSASLERTVVSIQNSSELSSPSRDNSLNDTPSEPDALEDAQEVSCSEADTTASSSFTTSPVALSNLYSNSNVAVKNVDNVKPVEPADMPNAQRQDPPAYSSQQREDEDAFVPRPLMHTVSFYRKQQQQQKKSEACTGLIDISEQPESNESSDDEVPVEKPNIGAMIRKLEDEVEGRNLAIAQASKALNWCKALVGFSDSTEYIECERILLIETQRRLALLNSIHRLKTDGALSHQLPTVFSPSKHEVTPSCKGNMKISDISVTLRREFFNAHRAENQYHFIGLVKNKHHIEHTSLLTYDSQKQGSTLRFSNDFVLEGLDSDFQINLEIYYLESAKEFLPHEAKYRINAKKDSKHATMMLSPLLTPSKKGGKGDHHKTQIHSPAGPDTVKSSSFKFCGGLSIDISSLQRTYWELDKVSGPLTGGISLRVQCSAMGGVEHKGFLTLFEDVSGYGAWVRRWCRLGPAVLEFWKYPEDETEGRKPPLGTLNLHDCVTSKVRPAPRDVCARANTLLLVTTRAPHPNDKDTLVTSCHKSYTAVRHLISADTREERDVWCQQLNKALANLRAWDPVAKQSVDDNLF